MKFGPFETKPPPQTSEGINNTFTLPGGEMNQIGFSTREDSFAVFGTSPGTSS